MGKGRSDGMPALIAVAESQHGVILSSQIDRCGVSRKSVAVLVAGGILRRVRAGAYAVGGRPPSVWEDAAAAAMLAGGTAALSHATAATLHRLPLLAPSRSVELTVVAPQHPRLRGVAVHRVRRLDPLDVERRGGLDITTPARTVVDLAGRMDVALLARVVDEGSIKGLWSIDALVATVERSGTRGRDGTRSLHAVLSSRLGEPAADSTLEQRVIRLLSPFRPFETQYQVVLGGRVLLLDIAWPQWRIGVEADGWFVRSRSRAKFDVERHRGNLLAAHGWQIAHVTSAMDDATIFADVSRLLPPVAFAGLLAGAGRRRG